MSWTLEEAVAYYKRQGAPHNQSMLIALLREIQQETGGSISAAALSETAALCGVKESLLNAVIRRIPDLRLAETHCLELCGGPNCGKHTALRELARQLRDTAGFELKIVPCMRLCGKGPNLRWDGRVYHRADEALLRRLVAAAEGEKS